MRLLWLLCILVRFTASDGTNSNSADIVCTANPAYVAPILNAVIYPGL